MKEALSPHKKPQFNYNDWVRISTKWIKTDSKIAMNEFLFQRKTSLRETKKQTKIISLTLSWPTKTPQWHLLRLINKLRSLPTTPGVTFSSQPVHCCQLPWQPGEPSALVEGPQRKGHFIILVWRTGYVQTSVFNSLPMVGRLSSCHCQDGQILFLGQQYIYSLWLVCMWGVGHVCT